jgi:hypothetical protein
MLSHNDPGAIDAFKGDFVVQIWKSDEEDNPSDDRYYVGLHASYEETPDITKTETGDFEVLEGMMVVATQQIARCPKCEERLDISIWVEPQGPTGDIDWDDFGEDTEYMTEIRDQEGFDELQSWEKDTSDYLLVKVKCRGLPENRADR